MQQPQANPLQMPEIRLILTPDELKKIQKTANPILKRLMLARIAALRAWYIANNPVDDQNP